MKYLCIVKYKCVTEDFQIFATRLKRKAEKRDPVCHFLPFTHSTT